MRGESTRQGKRGRLSHRTAARGTYRGMTVQSDSFSLYCESETEVMLGQAGGPRSDTTTRRAVTQRPCSRTSLPIVATLQHNL